MSNLDRLVASVIQFLNDEMNSTSLTPESKESLEVAIQCLQSTYNISTSDTHLLPSKKLTEIFASAIENEPLPTEVTEEAKQDAVRIKDEGNALMRDGLFDDALARYSQAIKLDPGNAVLYCNRAAAYSKLNQHHAAIEDCSKAISIDPNYSKAYGRKGLALSSLNDFYQAKENYQRAMELDPTNESYSINLQYANEKIAELERNNPMPGMNNLGSLFANPAMMNFAQQLLQDPNMQSMMSAIGNAIGNIGRPPGSGESNEAVNPTANDQVQPPPSTEGGEPTEGGEAPPIAGIDGFLRLGQHLAAQVEASNPELIEQIRQRINIIPNPSENNNEDTNTSENS